MDQETSMRRKLRVYKPDPIIIQVDPLCFPSQPIPKEVEIKLYEIFEKLDPNNPEIKQILESFFTIIQSFGHGIHPYITSSYISNLINLLDFPSLDNYILPIIWSCSYLSADIVGYFLEADSFIRKLGNILLRKPNPEISLHILKLFSQCVALDPNITTQLALNDIFNIMRPYVTEPSQHMEVCAQILTQCEITQLFVETALPLILQILNSGDSISRNKALYILINSMQETDPDDKIFHFFFPNNIAILFQCLEFDDLALMTLLMLNALFAYENSDLNEILAANGCFHKIISQLTKNTDPISLTVVDILEFFVYCEYQNFVITNIIPVLEQFNFVEFCKVCSFVVREKMILFLVSMASCYPMRFLLVSEFLDLVLQLFESTDSSNQRRICQSYITIVHTYQADSEFVQMAVSMWANNDSCALFCPDLLADNAYALINMV